PLAAPGVGQEVLPVVLALGAVLEAGARAGLAVVGGGRAAAPRARLAGEAEARLLVEAVDLQRVAHAVDAAVVHAVVGHLGDAARAGAAERRRGDGDMGALDG